MSCRFVPVDWEHIDFINIDLIAFIEIEKWNILTPYQLKLHKRIEPDYIAEDDWRDDHYHVWLYLKDTSHVDNIDKSISPPNNRILLHMRPTETFDEVLDYLRDHELI